ncbi:hypothetical protein [Calycomorphotria hydatis]|uniref:Uncharacterized protein n=1 Tax=Calycomorphotria hydatis TaxID=2528027 RepID=A0A517T5E1_9PLAN|nr:hypothetical protein [Calycomorphotria hydatis]QDT63587.1 hypothetical protein V22_08110 [Calycomorphotria hydatis]
MERGKEFDNWFSGPKNSFIKQIAKKKCEFGPCSLDEVRSVLLDLGWRSYSYVSGMLHMQFRAFQNSIPDKLSDKESELYELLYLPHQVFCGHPLLLLKERVPFLQTALTENSAGLEMNLAGVIHTLLIYYIEMVEARRGVDRQNSADRRGQEAPVEFDERYHSEDKRKPDPSDPADLLDSP